MRPKFFFFFFFFVFKQKTAYEIVSGDWSSDVCSSDLAGRRRPRHRQEDRRGGRRGLDGRGARDSGAGRRGDLAAALPPAGTHAGPRADARRRLRSPLTTPDREAPAVLRVAVPNKGSLAEPAADMLRE